jgi:hypothetical protein
MDAASKADEAEGRASYQDESDDVRSLLSDDAADFATADANARENANTLEHTPWTRLLATLGWRRPAEQLPSYYALEQRGRVAHPKPRSRRYCGPCLRYFLAYVPHTPLRTALTQPASLPGS